MLCVKPTTPYFVAVYLGAQGKGTNPAVEAVLMITPPLPPLSFSIYFNPRNVPSITAPYG